MLSCQIPHFMKNHALRGRMEESGGKSHFVKSVRIRSFSGPYFPAFGLKTERYTVSLRIQP